METDPLPLILDLRIQESHGFFFEIGIMTAKSYPDLVQENIDLKRKIFNMNNQINALQKQVDALIQTQDAALNKMTDYQRALIQVLETTRQSLAIQGDKR